MIEQNCANRFTYMRIDHPESRMPKSHCNLKQIGSRIIFSNFKISLTLATTIQLVALDCRSIKEVGFSNSLNDTVLKVMLGSQFS